MSFKDEIETDIYNTFFNQEDFGELHIVDGLEVLCMFDDEELKERQGTNELDVSESSALLFAPAVYFQEDKVAGDRIIIDEKVYTIDTWRNNLGVIEATLHRGVSS